MSDSQGSEHGDVVTDIYNDSLKKKAALPGTIKSEDHELRQNSFDVDRPSKDNFEPESIWQA